MKNLISKLCLLLCAAAMTCGVTAADKKLVIVAGKVSHGPGDHEFRAGSLVLQKSLRSVKGLETIVVTNGWPGDVSVFKGADAVVFYMDGGGGHPAIQPENLAVLKNLAAKGVGVGCMHFAVEVPKGDPGQAWMDLIGGYYEHQFSCNPMWKPSFEKFVEHPITRGVKPFSVTDEWYFNMRFRPNMKGVTPILVAKPSDDVRNGPYVYPRGPYQHIQEASGRDEYMMWAVDREDGGRGFGFTGGHKHKNWGDDNFRKVVLNAMLWIAKMDVPKEGVASEVHDTDLLSNLDIKK